MGIVMLLFGIGLACLMIWRALIYVVPAYLGFAAGFWSLSHGAGAAALVVGFVVAAIALALGRRGVQSAQPLVRWTLALLFAAPAGYAGYCAASGLAAIAVPSQFWQISLSVLAAICVAATAFVRLHEPVEA